MHLLIKNRIHFDVTVYAIQPCTNISAELNKFNTVGDDLGLSLSWSSGEFFKELGTIPHWSFLKTGIEDLRIFHSNINFSKKCGVGNWRFFLGYVFMSYNNEYQ